MLLLKYKFVLAIVYLMIDILWVTTMYRIFYRKKIESVQRALPSQLRIVPAIFAYLILLVLIFFVCVPLSQFYQDKYPTWFVFGVVGFCVYGIYNCTNGAIFTHYDTTFMLVDLTWGCISFALVGMIYKFLSAYK